MFVLLSRHNACILDIGKHATLRYIDSVCNVYIVYMLRLRICVYTSSIESDSKWSYSEKQLQCGCVNIVTNTLSPKEAFSPAISLSVTQCIMNVLAGAVTHYCTALLMQSSVCEFVDGCTRVSYSRERMLYLLTHSNHA